MTTSPEITALLAYFGGKRTIASRIVAEFGPHRAYWEPFCGSMALLLAKPPASMETVNDAYGDLINLARTIRHPVAGARLYRRLRRVLPASAAHAEAVAEIESDPSFAARPHDTPNVEHCDVDRAEAFFVASWLGRNGVTGTSGHNNGFSVRYTANGGAQAKRFESAVESIPAWRRRMRGVTILSMDAFSLLPRIEDADNCLVYLDPPYVVKGAAYIHDFQSHDHRRLAAAAHRFTRSRVVVSYYDHRLVRELYRGWAIIDLATTKNLVYCGRRETKDGDSVKAPEVLLINGPSLTGHNVIQPFDAEQLAANRRRFADQPGGLF